MLILLQRLVRIHKHFVDYLLALSKFFDGPSFKSLIVFNCITKLSKTQHFSLILYGLVHQNAGSAQLRAHAST